MEVAVISVDRISDLEYAVSRWLAKNPTVQIHHVAQSHAAYVEPETYSDARSRTRTVERVALTIFYTK